jgi:cell wall-associated protease
MMKKLFLVTILPLFTYAQTTIAVLDNQININHHKLAPYVWQNPKEVLNGRDDDFNGLVDDTNGWSFIDQTEHRFDRELIGTFSQNVYRYYDLRAKKTLGTITERELDWYNEIRKDEDFKKEKKTFSKYIHGTHITCIAMKNKNLPYYLDESDFRFIPIRYLGEALDGTFVSPEFKAIDKGSDAEKINHIKAFYKKYALWMIGKFETATSYLKDKDVKVLNASWGQGYDSSISMVTNAFEEQFGKTDKYEDLITEIATEYLEFLISRGGDIIRRNKNTLFVFSAGNKKENTDVELHYPSGIMLPNVLSIAASNSKGERAYFSNFGKKTVSVFAPGEAIESCDPNGKKVKINGTSQAAPYATSTARILFEVANHYDIKADPALIKKIMLETADQYLALKDQAVSSGIINPKRAISALKYLRKYKFSKAVKMAQKRIRNIH